MLRLLPLKMSKRLAVNQCTQSIVLPKILSKIEKISFWPTVVAVKVIVGQKTPSLYYEVLKEDLRHSEGAENNLE